MLNRIFKHVLSSMSWLLLTCRRIRVRCCNTNASIGAFINRTQRSGRGWVWRSQLKLLQSKKKSADMVVRRTGGKAPQSWVVIPFRLWLPASFPVPQFNLWCCINVEEFHSRLKLMCATVTSLQSPALTTFPGIKVEGLTFSPLISPDFSATTPGLTGAKSDLFSFCYQQHKHNEANEDNVMMPLETHPSPFYSDAILMKKDHTRTLMWFIDHTICNQYTFKCSTLMFWAGCVCIVAIIFLMRAYSHLQSL